MYQVSVLLTTLNCPTAGYEMSAVMQHLRLPSLFFVAHE